MPRIDRDSDDSLIWLNLATQIRLNAHNFLYTKRICKWI